MENGFLTGKRVVVVANPAARNGHGAVAASWLRDEVERRGLENVSVLETSRPGEARDIAARAAADVVVALGGDGVIHEIACGMASRSPGDRPVLGVVPCGNGNDFARTLGMPVDDVREAWARLGRADVRSFDLGVCNGVPFVQTLSFGLDAAIALGTEERRRRTGRCGTMLFLEEGISQLLFHRDVHRVEIGLEGTLDSAYPTPLREEERPQDGSLALGLGMHLLAVQIGPTYGGGFEICPFAEPDDGAFDIAVAHAPLGFLHAATIFLKAQRGRHLGYRKELSFWRARSVSLEFDGPLPVQIDGERIEGRRFEISCLPGGLSVLAAERR